MGKYFLGEGKGEPRLMAQSRLLVEFVITFCKFVCPQKVIVVWGLVVGVNFLRLCS